MLTRSALIFPMVSVSFVRERTTSRLTVRECSSIEILRTQLNGDAGPLLAPGMQVMVPADAAPAAEDNTKNWSASRFAEMLMVPCPVCMTWLNFSPRRMSVLRLGWPCPWLIGGDDPKENGLEDRNLLGHSKSGAAGRN